MSKVSKSEALEDISTWTTTRVVELLKNNGVEQTCWEVVERRKIDGDELLHLTEGKLALWKNDLATPFRRTLWTFVEQLKTSPEKYVEAKQKPPAEPEPPPPALTIEPPSSTHTETESDTGWDTDFEDEPTIEMKCSNPDFRNSLRIFQENDRLKIENDAAAASRRGSSQSINKFDQPTNQPSPPSLDDTGTYANCETTYANVGFAEDTPELPKNLSKLHTELQKSLAEKLKEQLLLRGTSLEMPLSVKPTVAPKPEGLGKKAKGEVVLRRSEPRTSFLHKKSNGVNGGQKTKMTVAPPSQPTTPPNKQSDNALHNLPKPPGSIGFDLVENLPIIRPTDDSDDDEEDYEAFDEQIVEQHQRNSLMSRTDSGQSLSSPDRNSIGSAYHPASSVSHDEEYGVYGEIYESIPEQNERDNNKAKNPTNPPPPLPLKPPPNNTTLHNQLNKADSKSERSLDKKSATLPHSGSNLSLNNAARPLPPPPELQDTYRDRPWYHQLTREQANLLIEEQSTYHNAPDGIFLMRPSTTNPDNPFTLVLWCRDRVYNVPVRRRPDNRYSLGKAKPEEQTFASVDDIVPFYKKEKLVLYTGGVQSGSTYLTEPPPKQKQNVF